MTDTSNQGRETILVVDDTVEVRKMICNTLARQGYTVLEAGDGHEALAVCEAHSHRIHLLLTDMVMPRMNGGELAEHVQRINPRLPMIFMSGYAAEMWISPSARPATFLPKPFSSGTLTRTVRDVLDSRDGRMRDRRDSG